jgi:hypothetical protein
MFYDFFPDNTTVDVLYGDQPRATMAMMPKGHMNCRIVPMAV